MKKRTVFNATMVVITILMCSFFICDWYVFYQCGPVEQCLADSSHYQNVAKFAVTAIVTFMVACIGHNCVCRRDKNLLMWGFLMALCADFCFKILHNMDTHYSGEFSLMGICFFMVVQSIFIFRHSRLDDMDNHFPWILCIPFAIMFVVTALLVFGVFSVTVPIIATYGAFLICSLVVACKTPKLGYFPERNARLIKRGMILFFLCDVNVGISLATGPDHSLQEIIATVASNIVWYFYTPALICLATSGYKKGTDTAKHSMLLYNKR